MEYEIPDEPIVLVRRPGLIGPDTDGAGDQHILRIATPRDRAVDIPEQENG